MAVQRALVIDDNESLAETLAEVLEESGFEVTVASSGVEALLAWRARPADLVVVDIDLPDIGGLRLARRFVHRAEGCKFVVMSAGDPRHLSGPCEELGAVFLAKPFSLAHLTATLRVVVERVSSPALPPPRAARRLLGVRGPRALLQPAHGPHADD